MTQKKSTSPTKKNFAASFNAVANQKELQSSKWPDHWDSDEIPMFWPSLPSDPPPKCPSLNLNAKPAEGSGEPQVISKSARSVSLTLSNAANAAPPLLSDQPSPLTKISSAKNVTDAKSSIIVSRPPLKILAIDPSVMNSAGWAVVNITWSAEGKAEEEWDWGAWALNGMNFQMRCTDLKDYITRDIGHFDVLVCEWPMFYASAKGQMAARQGYTINLAGIAMYIAGWFQVPHRSLFLYTAPDWKGTQKKAITARRFYKLFGLTETTVDHNAIDATMMLVHHCRLEAAKLTASVKR